MSFRMLKQLLNNIHKINDELQVNMGSAAVISQHNQPWRFVNGISLSTRWFSVNWHTRMEFQNDGKVAEEYQPASALDPSFYRRKFLFSDDILKMQLKVQSLRKAEIWCLQHFYTQEEDDETDRCDMSSADVSGSSLHPKTQIVYGAWNPTGPVSPRLASLVKSWNIMEIITLGTV